MNRFLRKGLSIGALAITANFFSNKYLLFQKFFYNKVFCDSKYSILSEMNKNNHFAFLENDDMKVYGLMLNNQHIVIKLCNY